MDQDKVTLDEGQEEQRMNEEKTIPVEELDHVVGGIGGCIYLVPCPGCGLVYCIEDQTVEINCSCGISFYPDGR
jgi:hypothetical protein